MDTHTELKRVRDTIGPVVHQFIRDRVGKEFTATELADHVLRVFPAIAPNSPYRILYDMRKRGQLNYELISRRASLYRSLSA